MAWRRLRIVTLAARALRGQRGQSMVLAALVLTVMLFFLALLIDVGAGYAERRVEQNAADGAATAAARMLAMADVKPVTGAELLAAIDYYARANGGLLDNDDLDDADSPQYLDGSGASIGAIQPGPIPAGAAGVLVFTERDVDTFFARLFDEDDIDVEASGAAIFYAANQPSLNPGNLLPIGIPESNFTTGSTYDLRVPNYGSLYSVDNSYKGLLNFTAVSGGVYTAGTPCGDKKNPNKVDNLRCWCQNGWDGTVGQGAWVEFYSGDIGNNITESIADNIKAHPQSDSKGTFGLFYVPIWNEYKPKHGGTDGQIHISGFASFKIYLESSTASRTVGDFVSYVVPDGTIKPNGTSYGPRTIKIVPPPKVQ